MNLGTTMIMILVGLVGLLGLFAASGAVDTGMYLFGLVAFGFSVLVDFFLLKQAFDAEERRI